MAFTSPVLVLASPAGTIVCSDRGSQFRSRAFARTLPDPSWRTSIELGVETGLRCGELTELRVRDANPASRM